MIRPVISASIRPEPRNAYERAAAIFAELQQDIADDAKSDSAVLNKLTELWLAFEACIPDSDKPFRDIS